jgi:hypothetical protein
MARPKTPEHHKTYELLLQSVGSSESYAKFILNENVDYTKKWIRGELLEPEECKVSYDSDSGYYTASTVLVFRNRKFL